MKIKLSRKHVVCSDGSTKDELLLEEQAIPFEELAMEIHQNNLQQSWNGNYNPWVEKSFAAMAKLSPVRFDKQEMQVSYGYGIR